MAARTLPSQEYLRECFAYERTSGILRWKHRPVSHFESRSAWAVWNSRYCGARCASLSKQGYHRVTLDRTALRVPRVIWKWMTGDDAKTVDHANHVTNDDRWTNLRAATHKDNARNNRGKRSRKSAATMKGVYPYGERWYSKICVNYRSVMLGIFSTQEEAHAAYCLAAEKLHGEFGCAGEDPQ